MIAEFFPDFKTSSMTFLFVEESILFFISTLPNSSFIQLHSDTPLLEYGKETEILLSDFSEEELTEIYHHVKTPAITNKVCNKKYKNDGLIKDSMICAGENKKDTCTGK